jgi:hypothetical protein
VRYETTYVIVAGIAWIRRTRVEMRDGGVDDSVWAVLFDGDSSVALKGDAGDATTEHGEVGGLSWDLRWTQTAPPFGTPHRLLRPVAPTQMRTWPALEISGRIGDRMLDGALGHAAEISGRRHAREWGWAHATAPGGRWAHLLTVSAPPLPHLSQYGRDGHPPGLPLAGGAVAGTTVRVGPYVVDAPAETFVGLRYLDTDGSHLWCYHSERGHLRGGDADFEGAALEIATRAPIEGWRVAA